MLPLDQGTIERLDAGAPDWVAAKRSEGYRRFQDADPPDSREEDWRYVDLEFDIADFELAAEPGEQIGVDAGFEFDNVAGTAIIVDGSTVAVDGPEGAVLTSLQRAAVDHADDMKRVFGKGISPGLDQFAAAHHAFGSDGVFLHVPPNVTVPEPIVIDVQATIEGSVSFPRLSVLVEDNADVSVVVHYRSTAGTMLVVPHIEADVSGRLRLTAVQEWGRRTNAISQLRMAAARDSSIHLGEVGLGGALARLHLTMELNGRGSYGEVAGLYFGDGEQVLDYRAFMNHRAPDTNSDMFLKGAVEDEADSVFTGLIRIEPEAQRTNAYQTNRNLVLSEGAEAQSVPNLEILANDVRCGHGSTVGPLDPEQRYYLMSRGLDRLRADRLQVHGFFEEAIGKLPSAEMAGAIRDRVNAKYVQAQEEGRV